MSGEIITNSSELVVIPDSKNDVEEFLTEKEVVEMGYEIEPQKVKYDSESDVKEKDNKKEIINILSNDIAQILELDSNGKNPNLVKVKKDKEISIDGYGFFAQKDFIALQLEIPNRKSNKKVYKYYFIYGYPCKMLYKDGNRYKENELSYKNGEKNYNDAVIKPKKSFMTRNKSYTNLSMEDIKGLKEHFNIFTQEVFLFEEKKNN